MRAPETPEISARSIEVAKAALIEAGRPDLAEGVHGFYGWPGHLRVMTGPQSDRVVLIKAFAIGHWAVDHPVTVNEDGPHLVFPV